MKAIKFLLKTIKYILMSALFVIFISNFYVMIKTIKNPGTHPDVFGFSSAVVISGSMQPEIDVDDLVIIKKQKEYKKGDIIAFSSEKSFITHRIAEETPDGFITKGDANNTEDEGIVKNEDISGEVILKIKGIGRLTELMKSPLGLMALFMLGFLIIIFPSKEETEKKETDRRKEQ